MRPRNPDNRDLPINMYRHCRQRKNGTVWISYYYRGSDGKVIPLGRDLNKARLRWAELEAREAPADLKTMQAIFDRYEHDIIPYKAPRTQRDNKAELKQLQVVFDSAPIEAITPAMIAQYHDA